MVDFVVELVADLLGEGLEALVRSPRVPLPLRLLITVVIGLAVTALLVYIAVLAAETTLLLTLLFGLLTVGWWILVGYAIFKMFR